MPLAFVWIRKIWEDNMKLKSPVQRYQLKVDCAKPSGSPGLEADQWVSDSQFILETIEFGYKLPFLTAPLARIFRNNKSIIPSRPEFARKFASWFSSVFQSLQMHYRVFCNLADSSRVKTNQEIMIFTIKKKNYTHVAIQVQAFRWKPKKVRLFSRNTESLKLKQR